MEANFCCFFCWTQKLNFESISFMLGIDIVVRLFVGAIPLILYFFEEYNPFGLWIFSLSGYEGLIFLLSFGVFYYAKQEKGSKFLTVVVIGLRFLMSAAVIAVGATALIMAPVAPSTFDTIVESLTVESFWKKYLESRDNFMYGIMAAFAISIVYQLNAISWSWVLIKFIQSKEFNEVLSMNWFGGSVLDQSTSDGTNTVANAKTVMPLGAININISSKAIFTKLPQSAFEVGANNDALTNISQQQGQGTSTNGVRQAQRL